MAQAKISILDTTTVHPAKQQSKTTVPLSILDAVVTNYTPCEAVWFFDADSKGDSDSKSLSSLQESLAVTLSSFPHFAGDLTKIEHVSVPGDEEYQDHTNRYGRLEVTFGADSDPGVGFSIAQCDNSIDEIISQRKESESPFWDLTCSARSFLPKKTVAVRSENEQARSPVLIRVTRFACGGVGVGVKISHPLADAQTLATFVHRWSVEHSLLFKSTSSSPDSARVPQEQPLFNPQLLDSRAAGDINASSPDESILSKSRSLPSSRYDWLWPTDGSNPDAHLPPGITRSMIKSPSQQMPKEDWDMSVPVSHTKFHFSAEQIQKIWGTAGSNVSRHDAIVAHVWSAINRARGLSGDRKDVSLYYTFGLRKRLGLPSVFLGSPILSTTVKMVGHDAATSTLKTIASKVRGSIALYTEDALQARLHDLCHEVSPQRLWEGYLGYRHVIFTSWAHLGLYEVDLGFGRARYVEPFMPVFDGLFCLMEGRPSSREGIEGEKRHWCDDGIDVAISISSEAAERLKRDETLWP